MRLSINTIKRDIKQDYGYTEYEHNYYNGKLTIMHEPIITNVIIVYRRNGYRLCYAIPTMEFMTMSRKEFNNKFNHEWYYNSTQEE